MQEIGKINRRRLLTTLAGAVLAAPAILRASRVDAAEIERLAGDLFVVGFAGKSADSHSARALARHIGRGHAGGVLFLKHNVGSRRDVEKLTSLFHGAASGGAPLVSIDHEGGKVQRLSRKLGYRRLPTALDIAESMSAAKAEALFLKSAREVRDSGFTVNLAPVVDLHKASNPVIGKYERSFGTNPKTVAAYAGAFVDAHRKAGIACALKHFPGHGRSAIDSHDGFVDITDSWKSDELEPFRLLIDSGHADMIMGGHLYHEQMMVDREPATFSKAAVDGVLRKQLGFAGVMMTDDLDMAAVRKRYALKESVLRALAAGNDLLLMSNSAEPDNDLPADAARWVADAVKAGRLSARQVRAAQARVARLKRITG